MDNTIVMESIFANAQQNAASLIQTATLAINAKVNTIEEAESMIQELSSEAVKYNELLTTIMNAMRQVESGDMQKEEAAGIITPAVKELKDKCTALKIANVETHGDDITEDEIAILRELIIGVKAAAEDRLVAIRLGDDDKIDPEVEAELEDAEEGFVSNFIEKRKNKKLNKQKIDEYWESLADKKSTAILSAFGKAVSPLLYAGPSGPSVLKQYINDMKIQDNRSGKNYDGKLSAKDYIIKTINGVAMAIMPGNTDGYGVIHILGPMESGSKLGIKYFFKEDICSVMMNPIKAEEVAPAKEAYESEMQIDGLTYNEIATESAALAYQIVNSTAAKTAGQLYKNAKKLYSLGSKDKALDYMKKAKSLYEKVLSKIMNHGKFSRIERTESYKKSSSNITIRQNINRTESMSFSIAKSIIETKIDRCTAHILKWTNKAGNDDYQKILDQLKADREEAKAAKKATKATESYELEGFNMNNFNYDEFMFACESMMDELQLELDTSVVMEADGEGGEDAAESASKAGSKLRSAASKFKSAFRRGDKSAAEDAKEEMAEAADELADAEKAAGNDENKKSKIRKAVKIGLIAAGTVAAVAGLTAAGIAIKQKASGEKVDIKGGVSAIKQTASTAFNNLKPIQAVNANREARANQKAAEDSIRQTYGQDTRENRKADNDAVRIARQNAKKARVEERKAQRAAKKAAKKANEAFGISEYDAYEIIFEALYEESNGYETDNELVSAIESLL